ncbi:catalytic LigB subunit of aromatic ring-opening dioxygenase [Crucibulum laeve]|uniref:Catalytic LigB subunit of aromatic ring-opening dioxygenase n=1 Tax=Crucibulum laeve TaxID=68775 RepID=A0A5C3LUQ3_9AGAR|nr:catalytic LigB subunit of aromatic ring-opening dioxygenase [Crucibulum laeve]
MPSNKHLATFFVSHGSPRTLVDETPTTEFYKKIGEYAREEGIQGIVWMAAHWETPLDTIELSSNPHPDKDFVAFVPDEIMDWYKSYQINSDPSLATKCRDKLKAAGFNASLNSTAIWHQDVMIPLRWMYPDYKTCPPMTVMSVNGRFDPHFHLKIGATLRSLRAEKILLIGSGGGIHNLYTVSWHRIIFYQDTVTRTKPIEQFAAEFSASMKDSCVRNSGPQLGGALCRLLSHPHFIKCNPTPEHFLPMVYAAGGCSTFEDSDSVNAFGGENWEMDTQLNVNFVFGLDKNDKRFLGGADREEYEEAEVIRASPTSSAGTLVEVRA